MVRGMRAAIAGGNPGIILLDIPWSRAKSEPDIAYRGHGGSFRGLATVPRLVRAIDPHFEAVYAKREGKTVRVVRKPIAGFEEAFADLGTLIAADPADYERLHQLNQFFDFDRPSTLAITFRVGDQRYAIQAATMRAWKLADSGKLDAIADSADPFCTDADLLHPIRNSSKAQIDAVLCL